MDERFADQKRNDLRTTAELIHLALTEKDEDAAWEPVMVLQYRASREVLEAAERLCASQSPIERTLGANILGQLGIPERTFPTECFECLAGMLPAESDPDVLNAVAVAFGHLHDPRCIDLLVHLKTHPNCDVRYGLVHGISGHDHPLAIETLIELSKDEDEDVRNWATFGLATLIDADSLAIRESLLVRTIDVQDECRGEALVGLARRKDLRVFELLLKELAADEVGTLAVEAAEYLADPRLLPALLKLRDDCFDNSGKPDDDIDRAIASCKANLC
jgi:HEAT repeat protein